MTLFSNTSDHGVFKDLLVNSLSDICKALGLSIQDLRDINIIWVQVLQPNHKQYAARLVLKGPQPLKVAFLFFIFKEKSYWTAPSLFLTSKAREAKTDPRAQESLVQARSPFIHQTQWDPSPKAATESQITARKKNKALSRQLVPQCTEPAMPEHQRFVI